MTPTAKEIARSANVSERSVFVHFKDLDEIRVAAAEEQAVRIAALMEPVATDGSLAERVDAVLAQRERLYPMQVGIRTAEMVHAHRSDALGDRVRERRAMFRDQTAAIFAPELAEPGRADLLDLLDAMLDWSFRRQLVVRQELTQEQASTAIRRGILGLLSD